MAGRDKGCLDLEVCGKTTVRDLFKLAAPFSWSVIGFAACVVYIAAPLADDPARSPRVVPALLALLSAGTSTVVFVDIFSYRRDIVYQLHDSFDASRQRTLQRKQHASVVAVLLCLLLLAFYLGLAKDLDACGHDSCGADASWAGVSLVFAALWAYILRLTRAQQARRVDLGAVQAGGPASAVQMTAGQSEEP